jgi:transcriptional regulator NrdR family protein
MSLCNQCGEWDTRTLATRKDTRFYWVWRSKQCNLCGFKFATYEIPVECVSMPEEGVNPDGKLIK